MKFESHGLKGKPYPHVVVDGMFGDGLLLDMRKNWPGGGAFVGEIPGNYVCEGGRYLGEDGVWRRFTEEAVPNSLIGLLSGFAEYLEVRFPGERHFGVANYSLMQSEGDYGGHDVHTHHYHDPMWVMTVLCYLDPEAGGHSGTTILKAGPELDEAWVAAQTMQWRDLTEEVMTVGYEAGRVLAFYESPISFHSVKASKGRFGRRVLRFHVAVANAGAHCLRLYGVSLEEYQAARARPTEDARVRGWLRRDIEAMRSATPMSEDERMAWAQTVRLTIVMPAKARVPGELAA